MGYPFKFVCEKSYLKNYENVVRWFMTCVNQIEFRNVIGEVNMCKRELLAEGQKSNEEETKKRDKKGSKKDTPTSYTPAQEPTKNLKNLYKNMDKENPSHFIMDVWKKTYSNMTSEDALSKFWKMFDKEGYSLWYQSYNYNEENKRVFMTSNAVGGFQQRTEEIRKWAFGVMHILGTEETSLEIKGVWLLRGDTVDHLKNANDDANWYTWKKLSGKDMELSEENKELVKCYWVEKKELEGKKIQ